jgi:hypothetical protein
MGDFELQRGVVLHWVIPVCYPSYCKFGDSVEPYAKVPVGCVLGATRLKKPKGVPSILGDELVVNGKLRWCPSSSLQNFQGLAGRRLVL